MIEKSEFGSTGHASSRVIFGAAALFAGSRDRADEILELLFAHGVNHIDVASAYGHAEVCLAPWLQQHREKFFLATKTGDRSAEAARESLDRSLERMQVEQVDLIQLHNLVDEKEWETALGSGGALEALIEAREAGKVRFIGVTGHGTRVAARHLQSLERFPFDSVLLPCNFTMLSQPEYAADFEALVETCRERGVAVQTIKAVARRRWQDDSQPHHSWYEPLRDVDAIDRAVRFVLGQPGLFLNSSMDANVLKAILESAERVQAAPTALELEEDRERFAMQPLFAPGEMETI